METRLERMADRCATHVAELSDVARLCHARLAEMVKTKYKAECGAVAALAGGEDGAENATPLEKDLNLTDFERRARRGGGRDGDPAAAAVPRAAAGGAGTARPGDVLWYPIP